ncbi:hypothetical protein QZH41_003257 [Actinostola sp. cb2023]|nr:hypothetical protein QZH41_003257 [Actinostola sp. cb2023]
MSAVVKPMRFAHSEGHTDVCYDETGEHLLTCGSDGDIRIYKGFDDSDPVSIQAGEAVTMVVVQDKRIFATPDNFAVQAFTYPEASSSCDGTVRVWKMENQTVVKTLNILPKVNDVSTSKTLCRIGWQPGAGKYLAIPVGNNIQDPVSLHMLTTRVSLVLLRTSLQKLYLGSHLQDLRVGDDDVDDAMMAAADDGDDSDNESLVATKRHRVKSNWIDDEADDDDDDDDDEFKEIRKLKAQLAAPLNFDDASNDAIADTASEVSVKKLKNKSDNYWIVGLLERTKQIRCILCKGAIFPVTLPRPIQAVLPLEIPLCETSTDKGDKEENLIKSKLMSYSYKQGAGNGIEWDDEVAQQAETFQIQTLMKMFALACKSDREFRAFDICELLPNQRSVSLAIRYAAGIRKMNLAERLNELARRKAEEEEASQMVEEYDTPVETA